MPNARILTIDEEPTAAEASARRFESWGYETAGWAASVQEAVRLADETKPDLLVFAAGFDGDTHAAEIIRELASRGDIAVVNFTEPRAAHRRRPAKEAYPCESVVTPVSRDAFDHAVETVLYKRRMEQRLRESEATLHTVLEAAPIGIGLVRENVFRWTNRILESMTGRSRAELIDRPIDVLFEGDEESAGIGRLVMSEAALEGFASAETRIAYFGGSSFDVLISAAAVEPDNPEAGIVLAALDIAARKQSEQTLKRAHEELKERARALELSEARFRAIFETTRECVFMKDRSLRYSMVNPAMAGLLRRSVEDILGKTDEEIFGRRVGARLRNLDLRALKGESIESEQILSIGGAPLTMLDTRTPMYDNDGAVVGICGISRNITERKRSDHSQQAKSQDYPSSAMGVCMEQARTAARADGSILLTGESGSGKDYLAKWIHKQSRRRNGPFFVLNCAAVPTGVAESELFGHESGAFSGANARKRGLLELAEGGTLLLNEVGELPPAVQAKILTFMDTSSYLRVGGEKSVFVDVRVIAATNADLTADIEAGRFRKDLYYRLGVWTIEVPPLRSRVEDIPAIADSLLNDLARNMGLNRVPVLDKTAIRELRNHPWPGNVRELKNVLERAIIVSDTKDVLEAHHLGLYPQVFEAGRAWSFSIEFPDKESMDQMIERVRLALITEALRRTGGSKQGAARLLGVSRFSVYRALK